MQAVPTLNLTPSDTATDSTPQDPTSAREGAFSAQEALSQLTALNRVQAVVEFKLDGTILTANDNFLKTMGYSLQEIQGRHHRLFCDPVFAASSEYHSFWNRLARGEFQAAEYKRLHKSGKEVWINASYNPVFDSTTGKPIKVIKFATDVTAAKLRNAEFEGKITAISKAQAIIEFNVDGTILTANENFLKAMGYSLDEVQGKHHRIFCEPTYSDSQEYQRFWAALARGEFQAAEYKRLHKSGKEVWINASYNPILDANGRPFKVVKFATDVTASKLRNAEFEGKMNAIDKTQAVIEFTPSGTVLTANENFLKTMGYRLDEIQGKHHRMFCLPEETKSAEYQEFWRKRGEGEHAAGTYQRLDHTDKPVWLQASYNPILDLNHKVIKVVKFAVNITEKVTSEKALVTELIQIADTFVAKTKNIATQATTVAGGAQSLGATTEEMNASVEELSASIASIAQNGKSADTLAKATQQEADLGTKAIARSFEAMELINKSSEEINEIVKVISEIAGQTNLLAFNAAIEAARAGEHGLGFSVVADEVRKLAERSSQATKDISKLIHESVKRVAQGGEVSKEAAQAFKKIVDGVGKTTQAISEISVATQEQQTAAKYVATAIQQVADGTEKSAISSDSIAQSAKDLALGSDQLRAAVQKFAA